MDEQPRLTDLVPTRLPVFLLLLVAGLALIAALEGLYAWMPRLAAVTGEGRLAAFDLAGAGGLAAWCSTMIRAAACLLAVLVYTVRRHRVDDYHGRYRIWLWAAACWMLLSLDRTAGLHQGFRDLMAQLSGTRIFGDGTLWWVIPAFFLLGAVGTRLLVDMRSCWFSSSVLVGAALCCVVSVAVQLGWLLPDEGAQRVMVASGAGLLSDLGLVLAMGLHARHVILDAQGLLPVAVPKAAAPRRTRKVQTEEDEEETSQASSSYGEVRVHPPHGLSRPTIAPASPVRPAATAAVVTPPKVIAPASPVSSAAVTASPSAPVQRKLTKEERKALKKKLEKLRRERGQGG